MEISDLAKYFELSENALNYLGKALASAAAGALIAHIMHIVRKRIPARLSWGLKEHRTSVFVLATSAKVDTGEYIRYSSGIGQIRAVGILVPGFIRAYKTINSSNVLLSEELPEIYCGRDLIVIGGPKNNKLTEDLLKKMDKLPYTMVGNQIINRISNTKIKGVIKNGFVTEDYGLIIKTRNPYNREARCLIIMGTHTYGLDAAATAFVENLSKLSYLFVSDYVCLVKASVSGHYVGKPKILDFRKIKNGDDETLNLFSAEMDEEAS
ncbi:hypothetical protein [Azospirillum brasilense]|uniref:Uncharacterized protein n=1 Tax=Azospirillum brasilense TaxID=192 RepID=A0A6L3ARI5_AZOBR|nr:hypothetical protein [Azospirillum brasilense]KAA0676661.1 hypothetical protein DS837_30510 [Azospirillum brasilense]